MRMQSRQGRRAKHCGASIGRRRAERVATLSTLKARRPHYRATVARCIVTAHAKTKLRGSTVGQQVIVA